MKPEPLSLGQLLAAGERAQVSVRVGRVVDAAEGKPWVEFPGGGAGPVPARSMIRLEPEELREAARQRREVVLLFDEGDPARPIIAGFLESPSPTPALDSVLATAAVDRTPEVAEVAEVDGRRVVVEGKEEVVLRCGESSITLRRNGKVVIRGLYVETHAAGVNRIKGGTVKIN